MRKPFKIALSLLLALTFTAVSVTNCVGGGGEQTEETVPVAADMSKELPCESAILIERSTGQVFYEKEADLRQSPASVTKVMTLLLVMEALEDGSLTLEDDVVCSPHASSMGGSQIWLEVGESMTVEELLRATAIASANDASVALAEKVGGSEDGFVAMMNQRAGELGMDGTNFMNASGLDHPDHYTTARDIATMSAELLSHPEIIPYTTTWMSDLRGGATQLVNTNKLVNIYGGATGLKTGTTDDAGFCLSASASRDNLDLIAVVLGSTNSNDRFGSAMGLLDYGFANYKASEVPQLTVPLSPLAVKKGVKSEVELMTVPPQSIIMDKNHGEIEEIVTLPEELIAPIEQGAIVGKVTLNVDGEQLCEYDIIAAESVDEMTFLSALDILWRETVRMGGS